MLGRSPNAIHTYLITANETIETKKEHHDTQRKCLHADKLEMPRLPSEESICIGKFQIRSFIIQIYYNFG